MSEIKHSAQQLRQAEVEFQLATRHSTRLDQERAPWQTLALRRFAVLCGIHSLLRDAARICDDAGADPQSPLAAAIRRLHDRTRRQLRNLLITYSLIAALVLALAVILGRELFIMSIGDSPIIMEPRAGAAVDMTISVSGSSPGGSLPPRSHLYVLVKPQGLDYWLQPPPEVTIGGWRGEAGIGQEGDRGLPFHICAILTRMVLQEGWHDANLPPGDTHCIDVTRK